MFDLKDKQVLVVGLGASGQAACALLRRRGASVLGIDSADTDSLRAELETLRPLGVEVKLGVKMPPDREFNLAVLSPAVRSNTRLLKEMTRRQVPMIGELELGFQQTQCLSIAISGTNGKSTTAELVERLLTHNQRKIASAGHRQQPLCAVADQTNGLDFLILRVNSFQLETTQFFRPAVAVLLNLAPDHLDHYAGMADYIRATARLFYNQQPFDWAIIQSEALAQMRSLNLPVPAKIITFSANNRRADICLDRGLLISRLGNWSGPLLDMDHCQLRGPHNAENLMAALAVGHVLRLPLEAMLEAVKSCTPGPDRCELVAEINGVKFINDSKATNVDALHKALLAAPVARAGEPNIWLIAGGKDKGLEYHDLGPLLSQRVKGAFLVGQAREKIRAAWSLFTPCTLASSLLEAISAAAKNALSGDVILLSPACSSFDQFRNYQHRGEVFRQSVEKLGATTGSGSTNGDHKK